LFTPMCLCYTQLCTRDNWTHYLLIPSPTLCRYATESPRAVGHGKKWQDVIPRVSFLMSKFRSCSSWSEVYPSVSNVASRAPVPDPASLNTRLHIDVSSRNWNTTY